MMKNIIKCFWMGILIMFIPVLVTAQEAVKVEGTVYDAHSRKPLANAQVFSTLAKQSAVTDEQGRFTLEVTGKKALTVVSCDGYLQKEQMMTAGRSLKIYLLPVRSFMQSEGYTAMDGYHKMTEKTGSAVALEDHVLNQAYNTPDEALHGKVAGMRVMGKGGMPGEGAALYMRGIRTMVGESTPLVVVDGMPYRSNMSVSEAIGGFSRNMFAPINLKEVSKISFLKGADAALYGSLGSNGVILIETEKATDLETKVMFHTVEGISFVTKRIPMLNASESKAYLGDIGENKYPNLTELVERLPFLKDDPEDLEGFMYKNNTEWQDEIYSPAFVSENIFKVKGGDAVAKYVLNVGTQQNKGAVKNTHMSKYYTRLNADVNFSQRLQTVISASLNYSDYDLHEQGMQKYTNPLLTAFYQAPFLSVHKQAYQMSGEVIDLPPFNPYDEELLTSNPAAVVNDVKATSRSYDVGVNLGFNYTLTSSLKLNGMFGLYYSYNKDDIFIPGRNSKAIVPLQNGVAENTVRGMVLEGKNYYGQIAVDYAKSFKGYHDLNVRLGYQFMTYRMEIDRGEGVNTPNDFYTRLGNTSFAKRVGGTSERWSWANAYGAVNYSFRKQFFASASVSVDGSAAYGKNSGRWFVFPAARVGWRMKEAGFLKYTDWLSNLTIRGEFGINGNSRYSSRIGNYYYDMELVRTASGIVRNGLPNTKLEPEKVYNSGVGVDFALIGNRINLSVDLFREHTKDMIMANPQAAMYGFETRYENSGEIDTKGVEVSLNANILNHSDWNWSAGVTIAHHASEIKKIGNVDEMMIDYSDGSRQIMKVGKSPYLFYGQKAEKVFTTTDEASAYGYISHNGVHFVAGDMKFYDKNHDKVINDEDCMVIGDPTPDFYGAIYTQLKYKNWSMYANFTYSYGNDIYNAVRRTTEAMTNFDNQSHTVARRWMIEGQQTDMPRASYGDRTGNSRFSSRWIEDGSYLKLKELTVSYDRSKKTWIFNSLKVYLTGENLFTVTKYLGMDPEFSYSYDPALIGIDLGKMPLSRNIKVGLILNF